MRLKCITVKNYRSIEEVQFPLSEIGKSYTYSLIGVNESGKTSFLKAVSLIGGSEPIQFPQDFQDVTLPVVIDYEYELEDDEVPLINAELNNNSFPEDLVSKISIKKIIVSAKFEANTATVLEKVIAIELKKETFDTHTLRDSNVVEKAGTPDEPDLDLKTYLEENLIEFVMSRFHEIVFWKSEPKFLITEPINLDSFAADPDNISIPLNNCFELAGISNILDEIAKVKADPAEKIIYKKN